MDKAIAHADKAIARIVESIPVVIVEKYQAIIWKELIVAYKTGVADSQRKESPPSETK